MTNIDADAIWTMIQSRDWTLVAWEQDYVSRDTYRYQYSCAELGGRLVIEFDEPTEVNAWGEIAFAYYTDDTGAEWSWPYYP